MPSPLDPGFTSTGQPHAASPSPSPAPPDRAPEAIVALLRDVRDLMGADIAVLFRFTRTRDSLDAVASSADDPGHPAAFSPAWMPFIHVTAHAREARLLEQRNSTDRFVLAAAPIMSELVPLGVLAVSAEGGLSRDGGSIREWLPRHAAQVARMIELLDHRRDAQADSQRVSAILAAVQQFQHARSMTELGQAICDASLLITTGDRAALVRWRAADRAGTVESSAGAAPTEPALAVAPESLVGQVCERGLPQVWEHARLATQIQPVYSAVQAGRTVEALGVYPLKNREREVVGAIVVEGDSPGSIRIKAMRDVRLLSTYAAMSLETIWEIEEVTRRARTDQLTGLGNRRMLEERLGWVLDETDRFGGTASLIALDIDHFKRVNDTHGHEAGDAVIRHVAQLLESRVRTVDVCARIGGEEFVVLLPQTPLDGAGILAERLRAALEESAVDASGTAIAVTASFGIASYPDPVAKRESLFAAADRALYRAKAAGRNAVCRCDDDPAADSAE